MAYDEEITTPNDKEKFLATARKRFDEICEKTEHLRAEYVEDVRFKHAEQWNLADVQHRNDKKRPALTINRIDSFVNSVVNDGLQNRPAIKVRPVDNVTDPITADVISGMIRHIVNNGDSKTAFDRAYTDAVSGGFGYFRVITDWVGKEWNQEILIQQIENPCSVYFPVHLIKNPDYSDAPYCFVREKISREEFDARFPKHKGEYKGWEPTGEGDRENWLDEKEVAIAEYFVVDEKYKPLYLLPPDDLHPDPWTSEELPEGVEPIRERQVCVKSVNWYLITGFAILDQKSFPGKKNPRIPIIPVLGQEIIVDGKKHYISLTRYLKEPQKMLNYWWTSFTEQIANAPRATWIIAEDQIAGYEDFWQNANKENLGYLPYKSTDKKGNVLPPPQRIPPPEVGSAIMQGIQYANEFMKEVSGIYDASLGATSNERSGKAILARQRQGSVATYHFVNNYNRAVRALGKLLIDIIPEVYDTPRAIRIVGEDMTDDVALINQFHQDGDNPNALYDVTVGNYDVIVDIGPSYDTKRMETAEMLNQLMQTNPQMSTLFMDILARSLDVPGGQEISERAKRFLIQQMPGVISDEEKGTPEQQLQRQIQEMSQDIEKLIQKGQMDEAEKAQMREMLKAMDQQLKNKEDEISAKVQIQAMKSETEAQKALIGLYQEKLKMQHDEHKHTVDTALNLYASGSGDTVEQGEKANPDGGDAE